MSRHNKLQQSVGADDFYYKSQKQQQDVIEKRNQLIKNNSENYKNSKLFLQTQPDNHGFIPYLSERDRLGNLILSQKTEKHRSEGKRTSKISKKWVSDRKSYLTNNSENPENNNNILQDFEQNDNNNNQIQQQYHYKQFSPQKYQQKQKPDSSQALDTQVTIFQTEEQQSNLQQQKQQQQKIDSEKRTQTCPSPEKPSKKSYFSHHTQQSLQQQGQQNQQNSLNKKQTPHSLHSNNNNLGNSAKFKKNNQNIFQANNNNQKQSFNSQAFDIINNENNQMKHSYLSKSSAKTQQKKIKINQYICNTPSKYTLKNPNSLYRTIISDNSILPSNKSEMFSQNKSSMKEQPYSVAQLDEIGKKVNQIDYESENGKKAFVSNFFVSELAHIPGTNNLKTPYHKQQDQIKEEKKQQLLQFGRHHTQQSFKSPFREYYYRQKFANPTIGTYNNTDNEIVQTKSPQFTFKKQFFKPNQTQQNLCSQDYYDINDIMLKNRETKQLVADLDRGSQDRFALKGTPYIIQKKIEKIPSEKLEKEIEFQKQISKKFELGTFGYPKDYIWNIKNKPNSDFIKNQWVNKLDGYGYNNFGKKGMNKLFQTNESEAPLLQQQQQQQQHQQKQQ